MFKKRVPNHLEHILQTFAPFRDQIKGFVVESTDNWYWLVDGLMDAGYSSAHLANLAAIKQYEGLKHSDDQHDEFFLAQLLILNILPQGYIYPKKDRPIIAGVYLPCDCPRAKVKGMATVKTPEHALKFLHANFLTSMYLNWFKSFGEAERSKRLAV
ncbi:MAG: hypothetical protein R6W88_13020 [Desulfobacterales bacterium]